MSAAVRFKLNEPQIMALRFSGGLPFQRGKNEWVYYALEGRRSLVVNQQTAKIISNLELRPCETFAVCRYPRNKWNVWLTPETEQARSAQEKADIERSKLPPHPADSEAPMAGRPNGPVKKVHPKVEGNLALLLRVPYNVAFREILGFVTKELSAAGETWGDQAKQDLICTLLIQSAKDGHLCMWERECLTSLKASNSECETVSLPTQTVTS